MSFTPDRSLDPNDNFDRLHNLFPLNANDIKNGAVTDTKLATRIIRGEVSAAGAVVSGTGFTASHIATGNYQVTFTVAFAAIPVIVGIAGATANPAGAVIVAKLNAGTPPSTTGFVMNTQNSNTGATIDSIFDFIAIGV